MTIKEYHIPTRINAPDVSIRPLGIILHYIGNPGTTAMQNANYFQHVDAQISVHYIVDDEEIIEIIPPTKKSYGTSSKKYNESFIQIEMCHPDTSGKITEATLENTVWLCQKLMEEYGFSELIRHYDVTGKQCPLWYVDEGRWAELKARILDIGAEDEEEGDSDKEEAVHWAQVYYDDLLAKGMEISETRFDDLITRGEVFALLDRALNL